jgi:hypothetical protein
LPAQTLNFLKGTTMRHPINRFAGLNEGWDLITSEEGWDGRTKGHRTGD